MKTKELQDIVKLVKHAIAKETPPVLTCINFSREGEVTHVVAADGFRLAHVKTSSSGIEGNYSLKDNEDLATVLKCKDKLAKIGTMKQSGGIFLKWQMLIPDTTDCLAVSVNISKLLAVSKALQDARIMRVIIQDGKLNISAKVESGRDDIEFHTSISAKIEHNAYYNKFAINPTYVYELCKALPDKYIPDVTIYVSTPSSPVVFRHPALEEVIMPVFVQW